MSKTSRTCSKCGKTYTVENIEELSEHFYYLDKKNMKFRKQCKECHRERAKKDGSSKRKNTIGKKIPGNKSGIRLEGGVFLKTCGKCKETYTSETEHGLTKYFHYQNKKENILENRCKECKRIANREYVQNPENKIRKLENFKRWTAENKEKVKEYSESNRKILDAHKALSNLTALSTSELEFFKEELFSKLNEINLELDKRNKNNL